MKPLQKLKTAVKTFNMAVIPLLVILAGLLVWFRWTRRQKKDCGNVYGG